MKKTIVALAISLVSFGAQAVELTNGENNELLINGIKAATVIQVIDAENEVIPNIVYSSLNGTGVMNIVKFGDATVAVKLFSDGIDNGDVESLIEICDESDEIIGNVSYRLPFIKTTHLMAKSSLDSMSTNPVLVKVGEYMEGFNCGSAGSSHIEGFGVKIDEEATEHFQQWLNSIKSPISVSMM